MVFERFEKDPDEPTVPSSNPGEKSEAGGVALSEHGPAPTQAGPLTAQDLIDYSGWASSDDLA